MKNKSMMWINIADAYRCEEIIFAFEQFNGYNAYHRLQ